MQQSYDFTADSGYILKKQAIDILLKANYESYVDEGHRDTIDLNLPDINDTDTIGRFYKLKNGHYLTCIEDIIRPDRFNNKILSELDESGNVLISEGYFSGNYYCCWNNRYEGFKKHGEYFSLKTCGTGSAHCSAITHLFKEFSSQNSGIYSYIYTGWCSGIDIACHLTSKMEIKNDTVIMHYTMEQLKERRNGKKKVIKIEKFDIKYIEREHEWIALDSTRIREFPL